MRIVVWYSCGITSAVVAKMVLDQYRDCGFPIVIAYCDTASEHPDNKRFLMDCEMWFDYPITILHSQKYDDVWDVYEKTRYIAGIDGARCSLEMKKKVRQGFEDIENDIQIFGFDSSEQKRADKFKKNNPEVIFSAPLIKWEISKSDCIEIVQRAGIEIPTMYKMGYKNNNCIGCPKGAKGYWNKIRIDFPSEFTRMAEMERKLGATLNVQNKNGKMNRVHLDELSPNAGNYKSELPISCGLLCE
jgi:3'-phosphoadenosine 5'-phosphosulfate sulfotransferase (PAPS reductase)/FAD synthetase